MAFISVHRKHPRAKITRNVYGSYFNNGMQVSYRTNSPQGATNNQWDAFTDWIAAHIQYDNEGELINMRTLTIELRFDADEEDKHEVLIEAAKSAAKHLFTNALLISTKRKPQIAMYTSDMFAGQETISLAADLEG